MRKLSYQVILVLISAMLLLSACSPATESAPTATDIPTEEPTVEPTEEPTATEIPTETPVPTEEPITLTDDLDNEIVLEEPAQKIISLSPSLTETLFALGAGDRIIGRDTNSSYPEEAAEIEDLGSMWEGLPTEKIVALEPDLVVAAEIIPPEQVQELVDLGLQVYWQANPDDFEGLYENILSLAVLVDKEAEAEELVASLQDRVSAVEEKLADGEETPLVFYELDATDPANPWTPGADTFVSYVIGKSKGQNLGDSLEGEWVQISSEALVAEDPDIILLSDAMYGITPESVAERPGWGDVTAVQEDQVYPFDPFILSVPGPRLVDGFEQVAELLHPELFEN
jgi:iron complex transport system substrate-binding protein